MADTKFEVILGMSFLKISNVDMSFGEETLMWKSYTINKVLPIIEQVQLINPKEFVITALDADNKTFIMHMAIRKQKEMAMDPDKKAQIKAQSKAQSGAQIGAIVFNKTPTEVSAEYSNYSNVFSAENVAELPENTGMNEHTIKLEEGKQPPFGPIYSLGPVELETLKTYIETNLVNGFIHPFKSPTGVSILFNRKSDGSLCLRVNYWGFNNITIKNQYPLLLIGKSLNWLDWAKRFT